MEDIESLERFDCAQCSRSFATRRQLRMHRKTHALSAQVTLPDSLLGFVECSSEQDRQFEQRRMFRCRLFANSSLPMQSGRAHWPIVHAATAM